MLKSHKICILLILILVLPAGEVMAQGERPEKPAINYVSFHGNDRIDISWNPSGENDISHFWIYTVNNPFDATGTRLDSVPVAVTNYSYSPVNLQAEYYSITAFDLGGNESLVKGDIHKPVLLEISYDSCSKEMDLSWSQYVGWRNRLTGYRIYMKENPEDDPDSTQDEDPYEGFTLVHNLIDTIHNKYSVGEIKENTNYEFYVEAYDNGTNTSTSNIRSKYTYMPPPPDFLYLDQVSVVDAKSVELTVSIDNSAIINDFQVTRGASYDATNFTTIRLLENVNTTTFTISDEIVTGGELYYYRVEALNSCYQPVFQSNTANNIILKGSTEGNRVELQWTAFTDFFTGTESYEIYRLNGFGEYVYVGNSGLNTSYSEDISLAGNEAISGQLRYYVLAKENGGNLGVSLSNTVLINLETRLFMPTAFTPNGDGLNDEFKPVFDFIPESYDLYIFDRSGKKIHHSSSADSGWDGTLNGRQAAPEGVYIYHIEYKSFNGSRKQETGNVTLVYPR